MSEEKTLIETIEENKKILRAEYQRGFANGGADMNEKWLITRQELIEEIVKRIGELWRRDDNLFFMETKQEYEEKLK